MQVDLMTSDPYELRAALRALEGRTLTGAGGVELALLEEGAGDAVQWAVPEDRFTQYLSVYLQFADAPDLQISTIQMDFSPCVDNSLDLSEPRLSLEQARMKNLSEGFGPGSIYRWNEIRSLTPGRVDSVQNRSVACVQTPPQPLPHIEEVELRIGNQTLVFCAGEAIETGTHTFQVQRYEESVLVFLDVSQDEREKILGPTPANDPQ